MKKTILTVVMAALASSLLAAAPAPKDVVSGAVKKLTSSANYSWTTTVKLPENSRFRPGPSSGKTEKDGLVWLKMTSPQTTTEAFLRGDKGAVKEGKRNWASLAELNNEEGPGRLLGRMLSSYKAPAEQAVDLIADTKELKKDGDAFAGNLTEDRVKALLSVGGNTLTVNGAKGSIKFWIKGGVLAKLEYQLSGKVTFNGNARNVERTTTIEIKDVGKTKIEVPADAKKKLESTFVKPEGASKTNSAAKISTAPPKNTNSPAPPKK